MPKDINVKAQVELTAGQVKVLDGMVDPERTLAAGSLGVYLYDGRGARGRTNASLSLTVVPWAQVRLLHLDL